MRPKRFPFLLIIAVLVLAIGAGPAGAASPYGEIPGIAWQKLLGGSATDEGNSVQQTSDGGYVLLGSSSSSVSGDVTGMHHGGSDYWVVKLDGAGAIQWQKLLGGSSSEYGRSVQQTSDGGYILLGESLSSASGDVTGTNRGSYDCWVVKLDGAGAIQWQKLLGGGSEDRGRSVQQTVDGGYILLGESFSSASGDINAMNHGEYDYWVVKLSSTGAIQWQKLLGGISSEYGRSVQQTTDGGYILLGYSSSSASGDVAGTGRGLWDWWVVKLNGAGDVSWQKLLGGISSEYGRSVRQTADGGYILLGSSSSSASGDVAGMHHGGDDYWVVKLSSTGAIQWQKLLGGSGNDDGYSVRQTSDGGYILLGTAVSSTGGDVAGANHGQSDCWVVKLTSTGAIGWERLLGGTGQEDGQEIRQTADGGYILLGESLSSRSGDVTGTNHGGSDYWLVKLRAEPALRLEAGWNFVSVPAVLAAGQDTAGTVFSGVNTDGHSIFLYDAATSSWSPMIAATKLKVLDGVWIYAKTAVTVPLAFDTNPQAVPPVKDLAAGWNAIGYGSTHAATARDALSPVASKWSTALGFDAGVQRYELPIYSGGSGEYSDYRELLAGRGYWLFMREPGQLSGPGV